MDLMALHAVLDCMATAIIEAESGRLVSARSALLEAAFAVPDVFPSGSPGAGALGVILDAVTGAAGPDVAAA